MSDRISRRALPLSITAPLALLGQMKATDPTAPLPDPAIIGFKLPKDLSFPDNGRPTGSQSVTLFGDPGKEGSLYGVHFKWKPNSSSRPHFHPNDRYIWVLTGTWWVGSGPHYDMASAYPMTAGSYVLHIGKQIHYDGAKDEECTLFIVGIGPASSTPAEEKPAAAK